MSVEAVGGCAILDERGYEPHSRFYNHSDCVDRENSQRLKGNIKPSVGKSRSSNCGNMRLRSNKVKDYPNS